jgi:hypothetical protein
MSSCDFRSNTILHCKQYNHSQRHFATHKKQEIQKIVRDETNALILSDKHAYKTLHSLLSGQDRIVVTVLGTRSASSGKWSTAGVVSKAHRTHAIALAATKIFTTRST